MKALIPLSNDDIDPYKSIKNEAFYFGTLLKEVFRNNLKQKLYNRRLYNVCYFSDIKKLREYINILKSNNNEIKYAVNHSYPKEYKEKIKKEIDIVLNNVEVDYLIIEDLDLVEIAEKYDKKVFLSTRLAPVNKEEAKFFYKIIGKTLAGFVMPRQATNLEINEINEFAHKKGLKLEVFFELGGCLNEERFCFFHEILDFQKNKYEALVKNPICVNIFFNSKNINKEFKSGYPGKDFFTCRSCLIPFLEKIENIYFKIVGRCFTNSRNKKIYNYFLKVKQNLKLKDKEKIILKNRMDLLKIFGKLCNKDNCSTFSLIKEDRKDLN